MGRAVNNKLVLALIAIGAQQAAVTEETEDVIEQILDYVATYGALLYVGRAVNKKLIVSLIAIGSQQAVAT